MATYVVGDIHGCYEEWMELKEKIEAMDSDARFILVGDIVDRGDQVMEMLEWAMKNISLGGKYQMVLGNHEAEKIEWWNSYQFFRIAKDLDNYIDFDSDKYDFKTTMLKYNKTEAEVGEIIEFFRSLPLYIEEFIRIEGRKKGRQHYIVVHASMPEQCINKNETVKKRSLKRTKQYNQEVENNRRDVIWYRVFDGNRYLKKSVVVHGHTPTEAGCYAEYVITEGKAYFSHGDINVDCGIVYKDFNERNLCAIRLEDLKEYYVYNNSEEICKQQQEERIQMKEYVKGKRKKDELEAWWDRLEREIANGCR